MTQRYRLVLFDCVNTLYLPDASRLPRVELDGRAVPSTAGVLLEHLRPLAPGLSLEQVHVAARGAWQWATEQRGADLREVPAPRRFRRLCESLALEAVDEAFIAGLVDAHMAAVTGTFVFPPEHGEVLRGLRGRYRLGLLSNFDHGPALRGLLERTGIAGHFDPLLISDGLGWRKPAPPAFQAALHHCGLPAEAALYVGDSLEDDVQGARGVGMDVAWINPGGEPAPDDCRPTHELRSLAELPALLARLEGRG